MRSAIFYATDNANIHRGVYQLSQSSTEQYEAAASQGTGCSSMRPRDSEIIFTRGTTEGINLVAHSFGAAFLKPGDEIIVSTIEHHANIVPWQIAAQQHGAVIRPIPVNDRGRAADGTHTKKLLVPGRTKMVAVQPAVKTRSGTIHDVSRIIETGTRRRSEGAGRWGTVGGPLSDRCPSTRCGFSTSSAGTKTLRSYRHRRFSTEKRELLDAMPPYQSGGDMILSVSFEKTLFADLPNKFEAGTPDIAGAIGLGVAIDYVNSIGLNAIAEHDDTLGRYLNETGLVQFPESASSVRRRARAASVLL